MQGNPMGDDRPESSNPPERTWQYPESDSSSGRPASSKQSRILRLLAVMTALAGVIIGLLLWIWRFVPPFFLSITVTEYGPHFPPISFAEQDSQALRAHFPDGREAFESQEGESRLLEELHQLTARKDDAVVVYLCAYGLCRDNDVYILPAKAKADADVSSTKLSLREVLKLLVDCRVPHKLLILDIMRPLAEPRLGILSNPVAERTQAILKEWEASVDRPFFVLCPCAREQVSLVSEELAMSVFGYYLCMGLSGRADGWNPRGKRDQRVSVQELADFVTYHVDHWADENRGCRQTPMLFGKAKDFPLVAGANPASLPVLEPAPKLLSAAWETRDEWWEEERYRLAPRSFRQLEGELLRADQRWRAGIPWGRIQADLDRALEKAKKQFEYEEELVAQAQKKGPAWRYPALAAQNLQADAAIAKAVRELLVQLETSASKDKEKLRQDGEKKIVESFKDKAAPQLAWTVFCVALDDGNLNPEKIDLFLKLIKSIPGSLDPSLAEIDFLEKLGKLQPDGEGKWPTEAARQGLFVVRERGKTIAALRADPRVLPWVAKSLEAAALKGREGEKLLFEGGLERATQVASVLENTEQEYSAIHASIREIAQALNTYEEALAGLPGFVPYWVHRPKLDSEDLTSWREAIRSAQKLGERFDRRLREGISSLDELRNETTELSQLKKRLRKSLDGLEDLERPFRPDRLGKLQERAKGGDFQDYLEMEALLESPRLSAEERTELNQARRLLGQRLADKTKDRDEKEYQDEERKRPPVNSARSLSSVSEADRGRWRARLAIDLLQLAGVAAARDLDKDWNEKPPGPALGEQLRKVWAEDLPKQWEHSNPMSRSIKPAELLQADRLSRAFHPFDLCPFENSNDFSNPASRLLQKKTLEFQDWLRESQR